MSCSRRLPRRARVSRGLVAVAAVATLLSGCGVLGPDPGPVASSPSWNPAHVREAVDRLAADASRTVAGLPAGTGGSATDPGTRSPGAPPTDPLPLAQVFSGDALRAVHAAAVLRERGVPPGPDALPPVDQGMVPLAAAGLDGRPRFVVAAQPVEGVPRGLFLLTTDDPQGLRVRHQSRIVTGSGVPGLASQDDAVVVGTQGRTEELAASYTESLGSSPNAGFDPDDYAKRVRGRLAALRERIGRAGQITQENRLIPESLVGLQVSGGLSVVFATVERTTTLTVKPGSHPRLPGSVSALTGGRTAVLQQAKWTTLAFLTWSVPGTGRPRLVAASEQDVSASGH